MQGGGSSNGPISRVPPAGRAGPESAGGAAARTGVGKSRILGEVGGRACGFDGAAIEDVGPVGQGHRQLHILLDEKDRRAGRCDLAQNGPDRRDRDRREAATERLGAVLEAGRRQRRAGRATVRLLVVCGDERRPIGQR